jgi:hypothetical protein
MTDIQEMLISYYKYSTDMSQSKVCILSILAVEYHAVSIQNELKYAYSTHGRILIHHNSM